MENISKGDVFIIPMYRLLELFPGLYKLTENRNSLVIAQYIGKDTFNLEIFSNISFLEKLIPFKSYDNIELNDSERLLEYKVKGSFLSNVDRLCNQILRRNNPFRFMKPGAIYSFENDFGKFLITKTITGLFDVAIFYNPNIHLANKFYRGIEIKTNYPRKGVYSKPYLITNNNGDVIDEFYTYIDKKESYGVPYFEDRIQELKGTSFRKLLATYFEDYKKKVMEFKKSQFKLKKYEILSNYIQKIRYATIERSGLMEVEEYSTSSHPYSRIEYYDNNGMPVIHSAMAFDSNTTKKTRGMYTLIESLKKCMEFYNFSSSKIDDIEKIYNKLEEIYGNGNKIELDKLEEYAELLLKYLTNLFTELKTYINNIDNPEPLDKITFSYYDRYYESESSSTETIYNPLQQIEKGINICREKIELAKKEYIEKTSKMDTYPETEMVVDVLSESEALMLDYIIGPITSRSSFLNLLKNTIKNIFKGKENGNKKR